MSRHTVASKDKSAELFTFADLLQSKEAYEMEYIKAPIGIEVSPAIYRRLHELTPSPTKDLTMQSIYGLIIKVDPSLKPGEWKLL